MNRFSYHRGADVADAVRAAGADAGSHFIAGGTNLVDLMKYRVEQPSSLVDINKLPELREIRRTEGGGLLIGALVSNTQAAYAPEVLEDHPLLSTTILAGATPQLRNMATTGGNLLQRTRCYYFYDVQTPCNKREPGTGCPARTGLNRTLAVLGTSPHCIATHPSDMCVALAALEAVVHVEGGNGKRTIPMAEFHRLPGDYPEQDTTLAHGELITAVELPPPGDDSGHYTYLKVRDRLSYAFALVSAAVKLTMDGGTVAKARIALGGVAHKPWRVPEAEALLEGQPPGPDAFAAVAERLLHGARGYGENDFKIELARRTTVRALEQAANNTPQSQVDKRIV